MEYRGPVWADFGDCPYLPDRRWNSLLMAVDRASDAELAHLMALGFRRLGSQFYIPACRTCAACIALRIPVAEFKPNKNQRQIWKRNQDVEVQIAPARFSQEKYELYRRYQEKRWKKESVLSAESFRDCYLEQPGEGLEFSYLVDSKLVGVGWVDITFEGLSSVYFVWDCEPRRSMGIYSALYEIEWCRQNQRKYVYLGLYVDGCPAMKYKASFQPHQRRYRDLDWIDEPTEGWPAAPTPRVPS
jgi:arginine-tRNA-protein transferase